jgi:putative flavoprotein involved in K+ transport
MSSINTVIIGAGQAGLAVSHELTAAGVDHVLLERGQLGERWRSERADSFSLLTPNWMSRLPGWHYRGDDPDGFMTAPELLSYFEAYARSFGAPVQDETTVERVLAHRDGYRVVTDQGTWQARNVVVATGQAGRPHVPDVGRCLDPAVHQLTANRYRNPAQLPDGAALVVGASSSGVQIADELRRSGREVVLSVGDHTRVPRTYRGRDLMWWLERRGVFDKTIDEMPDAAKARRAPSMQLVGGSPARSIDLGTLRRTGVQLAGRLRAADRHRVSFADDLAITAATAEARLSRMLGEIDQFILESGIAHEGTLPTADRPVPIDVGPALHEADLRRRGVSSVVWATGYRPHYPWLEVPVLDARGEIVQYRGVTGAQGLYVVGLRFQHRRSSGFVDGVRHDAYDVVGHLVEHRAAARVAA